MFLKQNKWMEQSFRLFFILYVMLCWTSGWFDTLNLGHLCDTKLPTPLNDECMCWQYFCLFYPSKLLNGSICAPKKKELTTCGISMIVTNTHLWNKRTWLFHGLNIAFTVSLIFMPFPGYGMHFYPCCLANLLGVALASDSLQPVVAFCGFALENGLATCWVLIHFRATALWLLVESYEEEILTTNQLQKKTLRNLFCGPLDAGQSQGYGLPWAFTWMVTIIRLYRYFSPRLIHTSHQGGPHSMLCKFCFLPKSFSLS